VLEQDYLLDAVRDLAWSVIVIKTVLATVIAIAEFLMTAVGMCKHYIL